jgi:phycoerythrin-associated linker protein
MTTLQKQLQSLEPSVPIELFPQHSIADVELVIYTAYRQVLGNAYVMESERLVVPESQLRFGEITVREFVRQIAQSALYRSRFFDPCSRYRAIELNFKHLLGRAPNDYAEMQAHSAILDRQGYDAEIDSYVDSDEYYNAFGDNIVPYYRGYQTQIGHKLVGFTNLLKLRSSASSSDKDLTHNNPAKLLKPLLYNCPAGQVQPTDINQLLAEILKPNIPDRASNIPTTQPGSIDWDLQRQCDEQEQAIVQLQQQLNELQPLAAIGFQYVSQWQTSTEDTAYSVLSAPTSADPNLALRQRIDENVHTIAALQANIQDAQRFASIGSARLNKWRKRTFSR